MNTEDDWEKAKEYRFDGMITDEPVKFLNWFSDDYFD